MVPRLPDDAAKNQMRWISNPPYPLEIISHEAFCLQYSVPFLNLFFKFVSVLLRLKLAAATFLLCVKS